ncbi:hypothetical protein BHE74_00057167, partial [Ensete ventricosum]
WTPYRLTPRLHFGPNYAMLTTDWMKSRESFTSQRKNVEKALSGDLLSSRKSKISRSSPRGKWEEHKRPNAEKP